MLFFRDNKTEQNIRYIDEISLRVSRLSACPLQSKMFLWAHGAHPDKTNKTIQYIGRCLHHTFVVETANFPSEILYRAAK